MDYYIDPADWIFRGCVQCGKAAAAIHIKNDRCSECEAKNLAGAIPILFPNKTGIDSGRAIEMKEQMTAEPQVPECKCITLLNGHWDGCPMKR